MDLILGTYQGTDIHADADDHDMINATEMCQAVGKFWANFADNEGTAAFLQSLSLNIGIPINRLVQSRRGRYGGTWVHRLVAIKLAGWCSPEFEVWMVQRIDELMRTGSTSIRPANDIGREIAESIATHIGPALDNRILDHTEPIRERVENIESVVRMLASKPMGRQWELKVTEEIIRQEGIGRRGTKSDCSSGIPDIICGEMVTEVKYHTDWKHAIGQVLSYQDDLLADGTPRTPRIYLFAKPSEFVSQAKINHYREQARQNRLLFDWFEWPDSLRSKQGDIFKPQPPLNGNEDIVK